MQRAQGVQSKSDALGVMQSVGMDSSFIDNALKMMDSPKAKKLMPIAGLFGVNIGEVKSQLNELKSGSNNTNSIKLSKNTNSSNDSLASLKSGLKRRK